MTTRTATTGTALRPTLLVLGLALSFVPASRAQQARSLNDEVYACGTVGMSFEELASAGVTVLSHAPWGGGGLTLEQARAFIDQAHRHGIRVLPYVSLYKVIDSRQVEDSYHTRKHPWWKEVDLVDHPEWVLIDERGNVRRPFDAPTYRAGVHQSCTNVAGIADAYVRGARNLMALGADGLFVDNVHPYPVCFGPRFGKHAHLYPDKDNTHTYHLALRQVCQTVKEYGADKVVILNTGSGPQPLFDDCGDGTMLESYICTFVPEAGRHRWNDWKTIQQWAEQHREYTASGKAVVALSYLGHTVEPVKDDAYYCAACAKMSGFLWTGDIWSGSFIPEVKDRPGSDALRCLWRASLGPALAGMTKQGGITYRLFEKGVVAVNPDSLGRVVNVPAPPGFAELCDLHSGACLPVHQGRSSVAIPPTSGRFYVEPSAAFRSYMAECTLGAKGVAGHLDRLHSPTDVTNWVLQDAAHQGGQGGIVVDRAISHAGAASLQITSEGTGGWVYARSLGMMLLQKDPAPVTVSYWAKVAPGSQAHARLIFDVDCQDGSDDKWSPPDVTESEWTHRQATYRPAKSIHDLKVQCAASLDRPGTVWFDDVTVTVGSDPRNWVQNPGFEEMASVMEDATLTRLQEWSERSIPTLLQLEARHRAIPSGADREQLVRELAAQQGRLGPLLAAKLDESVSRRLSHVREYAGRALTLATGVTLEIYGPPDTPAGSELALELVCRNGSSRSIEDVRFACEGPAGWATSLDLRARAHRLEPGSAIRIPFVVSVPTTTQAGTPVTLTASATFSWAQSSGEREDAASVVQTCGLRVVEPSASSSRPIEVSPTQRLNLHADPK